MNQIQAALENYIEKEIEEDKSELEESRKYNRASSIGWVPECQAHGVRQRLTPELDSRRKDARLRRILREGKEQEKLMRAEILEIAANEGWEILGHEPMIIPELELKGECDELVRIKNEREEKVVVLDYKSCSPQMFREISAAKNGLDLIESKFSWLRHYPAQTQTYNKLYLVPLGVLLFKEKVYGGRAAIEIPTAQYENYFREIAKDLKAINKCVKAGDIPIAEEKPVCKDCGFFATCFPEKPGPITAPVIIDKEELVMLLARREMLESPHKEYEKLDREVTSMLMSFGEREFLVGDYHVKITPYNYTNYDVPAEIKEKYKRLEERFRKTIKNLGQAL